jgi:transformation/transcription domain-associated protein
LSDVFWLKQGLDLLLAILVDDKPITLAPNSARVQPLLASSSLLETSGLQHKANDASEGAEDAPLTFETLVVKHTQFLNSMSKLEVNELMFSVFFLLHQ